LNAKAEGFYAAGNRAHCLRKSISEPIEQTLKKTMFGPSPPSLFVGWMGYPNVFVGPMVSLEPENAQHLDNPAEWYGAILTK